jgi:hypothetical protein
MSRHTISNSDDIIDSRDVIARISDLESELEDRYNKDREECETCNGDGNVTVEADGEGEDFVAEHETVCDECHGIGTHAASNRVTFEKWLKEQADTSDDDAEELKALRTLAEEADGCGDWYHGETLIRDSYFEDYARDLHEDINGHDAKSGWPYDYIDWEAAAEALQSDYTSVDFDGITYWLRS